MTPERLGRLAGNLGVAVNIVLSVLKIVVGIVAQAQVLLADGLHNLADVGASLAVAIGVHVGHAPPDFEHPYGHQKAESVAAKIVGILLLLAGAEILFNAAKTLYMGHEAVPGMIAAYVAGISLVLKEGMYWLSRRAAEVGHSKALHASAVDHRVDVFGSVAALAGVLLARTVGSYFDPLLAILVSLLVIYSGWQLVNQAVADLMDRFDDRALLDAFRSDAAAQTEVRRVSGVRGRYMGAQVLVDMEIAVRGDLSVRAGHAVAHEVKQAIMAHHPEVSAVHVHVNPEDES
jgi:cation diffusion facilitator family transporter